MRRSTSDERIESLSQRTALVHKSERGSALLIVFLFAAIVAIMLFVELPVSIFEAQRQKEQLLIDRGHEYVRAVQLFYRKNRGMYPSSIEQLESTNNIRYLRRRYKDPFTGKDDWRLLHAAPNGMLIDSKLTPQQQMAANGISLPGQNSNLAGGVTKPGNAAPSDSDTTLVVPPIPQRPPAVAANTTPTSASPDQNPDAPILPPANASDSAQANNSAAGAPNGKTAPAGLPGQTQPNQPNVMQTLNPLLTSTTAPPANSQSNAFGSSSSPMGQLNSGSLAGVASKAKGHSIKVFNDQDDYSLWEFYYNPMKDTTGRTSIGGTAPATTNTNGSQGTGGFNSAPQPAPSSPATATPEPAPNAAAPTTAAPNATAPNAQ